MQVRMAVTATVFCLFPVAGGRNFFLLCQHLPSLVIDGFVDLGLQLVTHEAISFLVPQVDVRL